MPIGGGDHQYRSCAGLYVGVGEELQPSECDFIGPTTDGRQITEKNHRKNNE